VSDPFSNDQTETKSFSSSLVSDATYNASTQTLDVSLTNGRSYTVENFPPGEWAQFKASWSPGRFFNDRIKGQY
jgi:hypothetical protein